MAITPVTACPTPGGPPSGLQPGLPSLPFGAEAVPEGACGIPGKALPGERHNTGTRSADGNTSSGGLRGAGCVPGGLLNLFQV